MANGKNGTTCWLAGTVRTLVIRVEMLEASNSFKNVDRNIHVNIFVSRSKVRVPGHKPAADLKHDDDFKQILSDDDGLATLTVPWVPVQNKDIVGAVDLLDVRRTGYARHLLLWLNTTLMLQMWSLLLWWTGQLSRSCMSLRCR